MKVFKVLAWVGLFVWFPDLATSRTRKKRKRYEPLRLSPHKLNQSGYVRLSRSPVLRSVERREDPPLGYLDAENSGTDEFEINYIE